MHKGVNNVNIVAVDMPQTNTHLAPYFSDSKPAGTCPTI